ncbi:MAG: alpha-amylase family protein [Cyclobacteriaceae bacterium]
MRFALLHISAMLALAACQPPKDKIPDTPMTPPTQQKMIVYQMMTRLFGNTNATNKTFGTLEENGVGKFSHINDKALQGIKELGVTHVWYTGVIEHALMTDYSRFGIPVDHPAVVKGRAGSPYAIKDYYDINPDLADDVPNRMREFEALVERTHANGLKVVIDFVPNHVARQYRSDARPAGVKDLGEGDDQSVSFKPGNNFYYLPGASLQPPRDHRLPPGLSVSAPYNETPAKVTGNDQFTSSPGVNEWFETIKLNYGVDIQGGRRNYFEPVPDTWVKMKDILVYWAGKNVDGFRCDMAEMVPVEFWQWAIPQVKAVNPAIVFIAEIYNPDQYRNYIQTGRFDFLYDKVQLYDTLRLLVNGQSATQHIAGIQQSLDGINHHMLHFLENHDEQRFASRFFAGDAFKAIPAAVVSATIDQGPMMIYFGQEVGEPGLGNEGFQSDDGRTTIFDYWGVPEHQKWVNGGAYDGGRLSEEQKSLRQFYGDILTLARDNLAINSGGYADVTVHNLGQGNIPHTVHAFVRFAGEEQLLIVSNFSDKLLPVAIQIPSEVAEKLQWKTGRDYVGRDLLRSGADIGFDQNRVARFEINGYSAFVFKLK